MSICKNIIKVGSNIRKFRELKAISQKDFAIAIDMPVSTLANYENNHRTPPIDILSEIAAALGVSVNDLLDHQELSLGSRIAECRKQKGLTQVQLAERLDKAESSIRKYEANTITPGIAVLNMMADILGVTEQYLIYGAGNKQAKDTLAEIQEVINNIEKLILKEGYSDNLVYQKGKLDGLRLAINLLNKESEEK